MKTQAQIIFDTLEARQTVSPDAKPAKGAAIAARLAGLTVSAAYRWTWDRARGGTGGTIPDVAEKAMIDGAAREGIALTEADFIAARAEALRMRKEAAA